jgi:hypothetical protein
MVSPILRAVMDRPIGASAGFGNLGFPATHSGNAGETVFSLCESLPEMGIIYQ